MINTALLRGAALLPFLFTALPAQQFDPTKTRAPLTPKPESTIVVPDHDPHVVQVKFQHDSNVRLRDGVFKGPSEELGAINAYLTSLDAKKSRLLQQSEEWLDTWRANGEMYSGWKLHDLNLFYTIEIPAEGKVGEVCDALNQFAVVQIAHPVGYGTDPVAPVEILPFESSQMFSPDFENMQGYRGAPPNGVNADYGNRFSGGLGEGHTIVDCETGWTDDHEDIAHAAQGNFIGLSGAPYPWDHGTAVLGELVGADDQSGVKGLVYNADCLMSSHLGSFIATSIANGAAAAGPGDILVIEIQCFWGPPAPHPCEWDDGIFATIQTATANGTHVFAAAGNGNNNLDSAAYSSKFDRNFRDSGAVMCGASDGSSLNKASFSNYGSRCDAHGWGFDVTTTAYGDLYSGGSVQTEYTDTFSGTSSATPIVTGAGTIINGIHREAFGTNMTPLALRDLLTQTGTPQGSGGQIGPRPDVAAALDQLDVPSIEVSGNLVPGGQVTVTINGSNSDTYSLFFSKNLAAAPSYNPPFGYFFLQSPPNQTRTGSLSGGVATETGNIPNNPNLSGQTIGYLQGLITFTTSGLPGTGTYTNYEPLDIQ